MKSINDIKFEMPVVALNELLDLIIEQQATIEKLRAISKRPITTLDDASVKRDDSIIPYGIAHNEFKKNKKEYLVSDRDIELAFDKEEVLRVIDNLTLVKVLFFMSRENAEEVLYSLNDLLARLPSVSIADLLEIVGETPSSSMDFVRGWDGFENSKIWRRKEGYELVLPDVKMLQSVEPTDDILSTMPYWDVEITKEFMNNFKPRPTLKGDKENEETK